MNGGTAGVDGVDLAAERRRDGRDGALAQLERLLSSPHFRSTRRCSAFLRYVVEQATSSGFERVKERTLGVEVFNRSPQYDTNQDPVVRITAGEVRKRLAQYYLETEHADEMRIALPAGSYVPEFRLSPANPAAADPSDASRECSVLERKGDATHSDVTRTRRYVIWTAVLAAVMITACATLFVSVTNRTPLDRFWAPVLEPSGTVLVCLGQPKAYQFNTLAQGELDTWFGSADKTATPPPLIQSVPLTEFVPAWDRYISISDGETFARLAGLFARAGRGVTLRGGRTVSLSDLRGRPVVLIGAFNNEWTLRLAGELRFYFDVDHSCGAEMVRDRQNLSSRDWIVRNSWPDRKIPQDYAIVTRVSNPVTEQVVVIAAGISHFGTQAAGEFLTNPVYFAEALRSAPADWHRKNIQVVLSAKVMSGTVGPPKVLAVHVW